MAIQPVSKTNPTQTTPAKSRSPNLSRHRKWTRSPSLLLRNVVQRSTLWWLLKHVAIDRHVINKFRRDAQTQDHRGATRLRDCERPGDSLVGTCQLHWIKAPGGIKLNRGKSKIGAKRVHKKPNNNKSSKQSRKTLRHHIYHLNHDQFPDKFKLPTFFLCTLYRFMTFSVKSRNSGRTGQTSQLSTFRVNGVGLVFKFWPYLRFQHVISKLYHQ